MLGANAKGKNMKNDQPLDVTIAVYPNQDLAERDFAGLVKLVKDKTVSCTGVVLVERDAAGEINVSKAGDHTGKNPKVVHKAIKHLVPDKIAEQINEQLPPGSAGVVGVYSHADADTVNKALGNATRMSTSEIDKASGKRLREGLDEAGAGLLGQIKDTSA